MQIVSFAAYKQHKVMRLFMFYFLALDIFKGVHYPGEGRLQLIPGLHLF